MKSTIYDWDLKNQSVILRIDANVPIDHGIILSDQRLQASLPTINLLLDKGAQIVILSHIGRPQNKESNLSNKQLISWFEDAGYDIVFANSISAAQQQLKIGHKLILLENIRFFPGEKKKSPAFAQQLAQLGNYYINDAFGTMHRTDTSIAELPYLFDQQHKSIGLLVEHELNMLHKVISHTEKPYILIIGGGKISTKIPLINNLLPKLSGLFLGPGLVFTFLKAEGKMIGRSLVDNSMIPLCKQIILKAKELSIPYYFPADYLITEGSYHDGLLTVTQNEPIPHNALGVSIGPKTVQVWSKEILKAKTILVNGLMGSLKSTESLTYVKKLYESIAHAQALTIIAGGDSIAAVSHFGLTQHIDYLSTGGGATLEYVSGHELPGLTALKDGTETQKT